MATIIDGKRIAGEILSNLMLRVTSLVNTGITPGLATVLVGDDPASHVYVGQKVKQCTALGMRSIHKPLPSSVTQSEIIKVVRELNDDKSVHGIIVQLPIPKTIDSEMVIASIEPKKDADGLHPLNQGLLGRLKSWDEIVKSGIPVPCTPAGIIELLLRSNITLDGKEAVVVGRSTLVGKPVCQLLSSLNTTVTLAHSKTVRLQDVCRRADILIAALGKPGLITADYVKKGAVVIDVGISRTPAGLQGDVDFQSVQSVASQITPVPGGVGPMTVAMLLSNTIRAAERLSLTGLSA